MPKKWTEVIKSKDYLDLSLREREAARQQYFNTVVAPNVPEVDLGLVKQQFDLDTRQALTNISVQLPQVGVPSPTPAQEFGEFRKQPAPGLGEAFISGIKQFPAGLSQLAGGAIQALTSPVETAESIGAAIKGLYSKITGNNEPEEAIIDALVEDYTDTYGTYDKFKFAIAEQPARLLGDLSLVLSAGGSGGARIANLLGFPKTASVLSKVGVVGVGLDPLRLPVKGAKLLAKITGVNKGTKKLVGNILTGAGEEFIEQAYGKGPQKSRFLDALRGDIPLEDFLSDSEGALRAVRTERSSRYLAKLAPLRVNTTKLNFKPIRDAFINKLDDFKITIDPTKPGGLDFSNSKIANVRDMRAIRNVAKDIFRWDSVPENLTPLGLDTLKQRLDDYFIYKGASKSIVTSLRSKVKKTIVDSVPKYATMTKEYEDLTQLINRIEDALALGKNDKAQTAISKLSKLMKIDNEFAKQVVEKMAAVGGKDIIPIAAGLSAKPLTASATIGRRIQEAAGIMGLLGHADPKLITVGLASSPRLVAEFLNLLGKGARALQKTQQTVGVTIPTGLAKLGELQGLTREQRPQLSPLE